VRYRDEVIDAQDPTAGLNASAIQAVAALDDDLRRAIYRFIQDAARPVTRRDVASAVGISSRLAAFHLKKLTDTGLLQVRDRSRESGVVGRRPRIYEPADEMDIVVSIPQRETNLLASILIETVLTTAPGDQAVKVAQQVAGRRGRRIGDEVRRQLRPGRLGTERALAAAVGVLQRYGFQPSQNDDGRLSLQNCPFSPLSREATDLVCGINHAFLTGLLVGMEAATLRAVPRPTHNLCCVELRPASAL
jgi:predicted ArsR family transcriptional regulator